MGLFTRASRELCYFCNNDYFELFKTIDNNYVCKDCLGSDGMTESDVAFMTLDELIKAKETYTIAKTEDANLDEIKSMDKKILILSISDLPDYEIEEVIGLACVESLVSLGYNMNLESQGLLGRPSGDKDMKFKEAKNAAILKLKMEAFKLGGDAVMSVNLSSSVFYDKRSVVASGTVVQLRRSSHG